MAKKSEGKIVAATGASSSSLNPAGAARAAEVQRAMTQAIVDCGAEGISDPAVISQRMQEARARVHAAS